MFHPLRFVIALALVVATASTVVAQQETATVIGAIVDGQGAALPGVTITARNIQTGFLRTGLTDGEGRYRIAAIPPGFYEFTADLTGFAQAVRRGVILTVGAEAVINFSMALAGVSESVTVTA